MCGVCGNCTNRCLVYKLFRCFFLGIYEFFKVLWYCVYTPHRQRDLINHVLENDCTAIENLLKSKRRLLFEDLCEEEYDKDNADGKTILEFICSDQRFSHIEKKTIETMLNFVYEDDLNPNPHSGFKSLTHFAVLGQNLIIIAAVLEKFPDQIKTTAGDRTPCELAHETKGISAEVRQFISNKQEEIYKDVNLVHPLVLAKETGQWMAIERELNSLNRIPPDVLLKFIKGVDIMQHDDESIRACYQTVIDSKYVDVNHQDETGNCALHLAMKYGKNEVIRVLLMNKASLILRNTCDELAIEDIENDLLADHFDQCIRTPVGDSRTLIFDYKTLCFLPMKEQARLRTMMKSVTKIQVESEVEEDVDNKLVFSKDDQYEGYYDCSKHDAILHLSSNSENKELIIHPLIQSFVDIKWHQFQGIALRNTIFNLSLWLSLFLLLFTKLAQNETWLLYIGGFFFAIFLITSLRAMWYICFMDFRYLRLFGIAQIIEILFLIDVICLLLNDTNEGRMIAVFLAAFRFLLALTIVPKVAVMVTMFMKAALHYLKILAFFFACILAFTYSFHTLSHHEMTETIDINNETISTPVISETEEEILALLKTIIMLQGEIAVGKFRFDGKDQSLILHVILIIFVYLMSVVMLNLVLTMTFADIQKVKQDAKWIEISSRIRYMAFHRPQYNQQIIDYYLNDKYLMFVSLRDDGRIITTSRWKGFWLDVCWTCMRRRCAYKLDARIVARARQIIATNQLNQKQKQPQTNATNHD